MKSRLLLVFALASCATSPRFRTSDHFDGERFFNATPVPSVGFFAMARHVLFGRGGRWPDEPVSNAARPDLDAHRAPRDIAVTHINHATMLLQLPGLNVLTDPVWSMRVGPGGWLGPKRAHAPALAIESLPHIDVVVVSHNHFDHLDLPTLRDLDRLHQPRFFVPLGDAELLEEAGISQVVELDWWQEVALDGGYRLTFTPAQHNSGRSPWSHDRSLWGSYVIAGGDHVCYFAGDTAFADHFEAVRQRFGPIDLAMLPIGAYAPRERMRAYHMDPADAVQAHIALGAKVSVGMHYGTFQLTAEDHDAPPRELAEAIAAEARFTGRFEVIGVGRTLVVTSPAEP